MNTYTPRNDSGQFKSWNTVTDEHSRQGFDQGYGQGYNQGSQYDSKDVVIGAGIGLLAIGVAEGVKQAWNYFRKKK